MKREIATTALTLVFALAAACAAGCARDRRESAGPAPKAGTPAATRPEIKSFTGTLRGGKVGIGGETTGWVLEGDGAVGGLDVDVSKVQATAEKLNGKRVTVAGYMTERDWPERGRTPVLVAHSIEEAPDQPESGGKGGTEEQG